MHHDRLIHRFRLLLHLLSRLEARDAGQIPQYGALPGLKEVPPPSADDWAGYEHALLGLATRSLEGLEIHQRALGRAAFPDHSCWTWEAKPTDPTRRRLYPSRDHALAHAEGSLEPGSPYLIGRIALPELGSLVPGIDLVLDHMEARLTEAYPGHYLPWPSIDAPQKDRLERLFQGLMVTFFLDEICPPAYGPLEDVERRVAGAGSLKIG